jgi:diacylglycerol kinase family enzyme
MPGIGVVTNPHSRRNRRYPEQVHRLGYLLGEDDVHDATRSVDDIEAVARRFRDAEIDVLALNGGDGTNHVTLTTFVEVYGEQPLPMVALLRGGTMNTVSNAIGIEGQPNALLVNIVEKYYLGQPFEISERDLMRITADDADDGRPAYGFIYGNGFVSNFLSAYYGTGRPSPTTAAKLLSRALASAVVGGQLIQGLARTVRAKLWADDEEWVEGDFGAIMASTIDQLGLGFRPFVRCEAQPKTFHVLAVDPNPLNVIRMLPACRLGRPLPQAYAPDKVAKKLVIEADEPLEYTIDGDLHRGGRRAVLEVGPRMRVIVK